MRLSPTQQKLYAVLVDIRKAGGNAILTGSAYNDASDTELLQMIGVYADGRYVGNCITRTSQFINGCNIDTYCALARNGLIGNHNGLWYALGE